MSLKYSYLKLFILISVFTFNLALASPQGVCPVLRDNKVRQIYIFDGKPSELAYLAPDDGATGPYTYSLGHIYNEGRTVTIRCEYGSGFVRDVELKNKVRKCLDSKRESGEPRLTCQ